MAYVVVVGGILKCSHQGRTRITQGDSRLDVDGNAVVLQGQEIGISFAPGSPGGIAPCPFTSSGNPSPCTATIAATDGISTQITVAQQGALLDTAGGSATNANDPSATWSVDMAGQSKLEANA